jgi:hypothetical protein
MINQWNVQLLANFLDPGSISNLLAADKGLAREAAGVWAHVGRYGISSLADFYIARAAAHDLAPDEDPDVIVSRVATDFAKEPFTISVGALTAWSIKDVAFRVTSRTAIAKVFRVYCETERVYRTDVIFRLDGKMIRSPEGTVGSGLFGVIWRGYHQRGVGAPLEAQCVA